MSDPHPARSSDREDKRTFLQKVAGFIHPAKPESTDDLIGILAEAEEDDLIAADSRVMLEGVLRMADMTATDAMVPVSRMDFLDIDAPFESLMHSVIQTAHSRFPVYSGERENIVGILLAKDLLKLQRAPELSLRTLLRPPVFVPESKGLNDLLRDFRANRSHMALVVDEFGNLAGCITIEDVLEEIVGEIEDEFDTPEEEGSIFGLADGSYRVSGDTPVGRVAESFSTVLAPSDPEEEPFDTIGGLIAHEMGHVPQRGESHELGGLRFLVMHARGGAVRWFKVSPAEPAPADPDAE